MSRLLFQKFNYEVEEDPIVAVNGAKEAYITDIVERAFALAAGPAEDWTELAIEKYEQASGLAEDMLSCSKQTQLQSACRGEKFIEGLVVTRSLGNFLLRKAVRCEDSSPDYRLLFSHEKLASAFEEDEDTHEVAKCVAVIEPPNGIYHPSHSAELIVSYKNLLTVANDRMHHRRKFV